MLIAYRYGGKASVYNGGFVPHHCLYHVLPRHCVTCYQSLYLYATELTRASVYFPQTYGFDMLFTLLNLERMGLLRSKQSVGWSSANFQSLKRALNLLVDGVKMEEPEDIAYTTAG